MNTPEIKNPQLNIAGKLLVNGEHFQVGQIGQNSLVLQEPRDIAPCDAELIVTVNGQNNIYPIYLPQGVSCKSQTVAMIDLSAT